MYYNGNCIIMLRVHVKQGCVIAVVKRWTSAALVALENSYRKRRMQVKMDFISIYFSLLPLSLKNLTDWITLIPGKFRKINCQIDRSEKQHTRDKC